MNKTQKALKLALEGLEKWHFDKDPRGAADYITAIREALTEESSGTEQPPCKYPNCDYPCPDLPDCRDAEPPCKTGSQCTSKCEQCRYKYDCDKAEQPAQQPHCDDCGGFDPECPLAQPAQQIVEEYAPDNRTISVYPSEWKAQQQEPIGYVRPEVIAALKRGVRWGGERLSPLADEEDGLTAPIYTSPQPAQQQEPYGWKVYGVNSLFVGEFAEDDAKAEAKHIGGACIAFPLYTSPPASKPWLGLSTIELDEIDMPIRERGHATIAEIYRAIEAKLKEKNA